MAEHCFTYGSLMCADIMTAVSGVSCRSAPARLSGYRRSPVTGQCYPGMRPAAGQAVSGVLYFDVPSAAWLRLDRFEGTQYERCRVEVLLRDGSRASAWAYVFRREYASRLGRGEWDFETFLRDDKAGLVASLRSSPGTGADRPG